MNTLKECQIEAGEKIIYCLNKQNKICNQIKQKFCLEIQGLVPSSKANCNALSQT